MSIHLAMRPVRRIVQCEGIVSLAMPCFPNSSSCKDYATFIAETLLERVRNGSVTAVGQVDCCDSPYLVLPLTIEPSKLRLCHDERYLNLRIHDNLFLLDTLKSAANCGERCFSGLVG